MRGKRFDYAQGSEEWKRARVGSLGASRISEALARTKSGWGASRDNLMAELLCERLTGKPAEKFVSAAMARGTEKEHEARDAYSVHYDVNVELVGLYKHPTIKDTHASPDGLVGDDGLIEIKVPNSSTHLNTLLSENIDRYYITQMQWQMACSGRQWCDFVSYDPGLPWPMHLFVKRVPRDESNITHLEKLVPPFLTELDTRLCALKSKYNLLECLKESITTGT